MKGAQTQDWVAGPASLRGGVGAETPVNREFGRCCIAGSETGGATALGLELADH